MNSKIKMFCFTYAGGAASFYNEIEQSLKDNIELVKLDYAGHGKRYREDLYSDFKELAEDMYNQVKMQCDENTPYVFMGYSMGSIVVFELLRMIACRKEIEFLLCFRKSGKQGYIILRKYCRIRRIGEERVKELFLFFFSMFLIVVS